MDRNKYMCNQLDIFFLQQKKAEANADLISDCFSRDYLFYYANLSRKKNSSGLQTNVLLHRTKMFGNTKKTCYAHMRAQKDNRMYMYFTITYTHTNAATVV